MPALADLNLTFGAAFVGLIFSSILYGITILQTYLYFRMYPNDSWRTKGLVGILFALDTVHIALCIYSIYWYLITQYGDTVVLDNILWSISIQTIFNGTIADIVQLYFAHRVYKLSKNWYLTIAIVVFALGHFAIVIQFPVKSFEIKVFSKFPVEQVAVCVGFACSAVADGLIAIAMCYYLAKQRTQFSRTNSVITTLIIYSVNTGLLTSMISVACLIAFAVSPNTFVWLACFWVLGKCYSNSLMGMLNSRSHIREGSGREKPTFVELERLPETQSSTNSRVRAAMFRKPSNPTALAVTVQTTTQRDIDIDQDVKSNDWSSDMITKS